MERKLKILSALFECLGEVIDYIKRNKSYYTHTETDENGNEIHSEPTIEEDGEYTYDYYQAWDGLEKFFRAMLK